MPIWITNLVKQSVCEVSELGILSYILDSIDPGSLFFPWIWMYWRFLYLRFQLIAFFLIKPSAKISDRLKWKNISCQSKNGTFIVFLAGTGFKSSDMAEFIQIDNIMHCNFQIWAKIREAHAFTTWAPESGPSVDSDLGILDSVLKINNQEQMQKFIYTAKFLSVMRILIWKFQPIARSFAKAFSDFGEYDWKCIWLVRLNWINSLTTGCRTLIEKFQSGHD